MSSAPVDYIKLVPGQRHFHCQKLFATLDTGSCADRWRRSEEADFAEKLVTCRRCSIGARHHSELDGEAIDQAKRAPLCIRCGRPSSRLVGQEICPSCFNRHGEFKKGRDARGNVPANYVAPSPRRIGVDESWAMFLGQNIAESMMRAIRSGFQLHSKQPGCTVWNHDRQAFEYQDGQGRTLLEVNVNDGSEFVAVEKLRPGEIPASVRQPVVALTKDLCAKWLEISGEGALLTGDWRQLDIACGSCRKGVLHGRQRHGTFECRCSAVGCF